MNETPDTLENTAAKEPRGAEFQPEYLDPSSPAFDPSAGLERWAQQMDVYTGPDAMLDFNQVDYVHINLIDANP